MKITEIFCIANWMVVDSNPKLPNTLFNKEKVKDSSYAWLTLLKGFPLLPNIRDDPLLVRDDMQGQLGLGNAP